METNWLDRALQIAAAIVVIFGGAVATIRWIRSRRRTLVATFDWSEFRLPAAMCAWFAKLSKFDLQAQVDEALEFTHFDSPALEQAARSHGLRVARQVQLRIPEELPLRFTHMRSCMTCWITNHGDTAIEGVRLLLPKRASFAELSRHGAAVVSIEDTDDVALKVIEVGRLLPGEQVAVQAWVDDRPGYRKKPELTSASGRGQVNALWLASEWAQDAEDWYKALIPAARFIALIVLSIVVVQLVMMFLRR